jgi:hypothetical protein
LDPLPDVRARLLRPDHGDRPDVEVAHRRLEVLSRALQVLTLPLSHVCTM